MYFNNAQCDIYIGTGAGKKLMEEISTARYSVKIVSPFLSADLLDGLAVLHKKGVRIELITTMPEEGGTSLLRRLIHQHVNIDRTARHQLRLLKWMLWSCYALMAIVAVVSWFFFFRKVLPELFLGMATMVLLGLIVMLLRYFIRKRKVYSYEYETIFPLRVLQNNNAFGRKTTYLHSKIYIIDDRVAYLGSLNFTHSGTECNYETRVRLTDTKSVKKIVEEFHYLMDEANLPEIDLNKLVKRYFREQLN